jgi:hypothetical protein
MSKSTAVEKAAPAGVPALASTPSVSLELDSADVSLPRIRIAQGQSVAVQDGLVTLGDIFASTGKDDPDPVVLTGFGEDAPGVLVHVLAVKKGKSLTIDGELNTWSFNDPDAPVDARTTYDYTVVLPEVDPDVPYKFLLSGTSTPAAKTINTILLKNADRGPSYTLAFRFRTAKRETSKGGQTYKYYVARVRQEDAKDAHVQLASDLAGMIAGAAVEQTSGSSSAPAI